MAAHKRQGTQPPALAQQVPSSASEWSEQGNLLALQALEWLPLYPTTALPTEAAEIT